MMVSEWALTLAYWLHMLATVVWIGGLATLNLLVIPAAKYTLETGVYAGLLERVQRRLNPLGWFCLLVLLVTGLFQMSAHPHYQGFLEIENRWTLAILLKHGVFAGMVAVSAYFTWGVLPKMRRVALKLSQGLDAPEAQRLQRQEVYLLRLNLALATLVLALTALARVS